MKPNKSKLSPLAPNAVYRDSWQVRTAAPAHLDTDHEWSWSLPFATSSVSTARINVTVALRHLAVGQATVDDARVVVSELLGNAIRHARPLPDGSLTVNLLVGQRVLRLAVDDGGSPTLPALLRPPVLAPSGRGLSIVRTLSTAWGVHEGVSGNTVFGVLRRH